MRRSFIARMVFTTLALAALTTTANAQWAIGAPGSRQAPAGKHRYVFLVYANPVPGMQESFNDWYDNQHIGDLVQMPGWTGAQRFRIVGNVTPRPTTLGYRHGYLVLWDIEDTTAVAATRPMLDGLRGGKVRRGAAFDYSPGAAASGMYEVMGPRITRPDGKGATIPDRNDPKAVRLDRFMLMELSEPAAGTEAGFDAAMNQRIKDVLALPGWLAAQRFKAVADSGLSGGSSKPQYLTVWEIQARSAQDAQAALADATKAGRVKVPAVDDKTAELVYWQPITAYLTKEDFER